MENLDYYRIAQKPYSSYEVLVDATSGDIGPSTVGLTRVASDGTTVIQFSVPVSPLVFSRSLRWANTTGSEVNFEYVVVRPAGPGSCVTNCGPEDVYNIHAFETTYSIPRFNNAGTPDHRAAAAEPDELRHQRHHLFLEHDGGPHRQLRQTPSLPRRSWC